MHERIKKIRDVLGIKQKDFADKLGIRQTGLSWLESGERKITDRIIKTICAVFNVNEDWLRTGNGGDDAMFNEQQQGTLIDELAEQYKLSEYGKKAIQCYLNLDEFQRKVIDDYLKAISGSNSDSQNSENPENNEDL